MNPEIEVRRRIEERGKLTFAEFMEVALYWPQGGYYAGLEPVGAQGDFYTSPAVHPSFGALLAVQLFQMWREMDRPSPFTVLELGAGNGLLCRDIASYAAELPEGFAVSLRYICLDRRHTQQIESGTPGASRVLADGLPFKGLTGCILSNEYLDAFPVHQVVMTNDGLREVYVGLEGEGMVEITGALSDPGLATRLDDLDITLAQGQTAEINLALDGWYRDAAETLEQGFVLTVDYGRDAKDLYDPESRPRGTLVTYHQHVQTDAPLTLIGNQDITAQVDFTSVACAGERAGLETVGLVTQRGFLANLGHGQFQEKLRTQALPMQQMQANRSGMLDLVRPGGLGKFKVLVQGKNVGSPTMWGLGRSPEAAAMVDGLPVPLLTGEHLSLPDGRFTGGEMEFEAFWPT